MATHPQTGEVTPLCFGVAGKLDCPQYQRCKALVEELGKLNSKVTYDLQPFIETDWSSSFLPQKRLELGVPNHKVSPLVWYNGCNYIGSAEQFVLFAERVLNFKMQQNTALLQSKARRAMNDWVKSSPHPFTYMDFRCGDEDLGRIIFELFDTTCPKTCENFRALSTGAGGKSYEGSPIHRVLKGGFVQGGDISGGHGDGGESIFGGTFEDESFSVLHDRAGILGMAGHGPHTNGSQFYITKAAAPWLDQKKVAFGRVVSGMRVLNLLEGRKLQNQRPVEDVVVKACGDYPIAKQDKGSETKEGKASD